MKYSLVTFFICFWTLSSFSQSSKLDQKYGFSKFQLGMNLTDVKKIAKVKRAKVTDNDVYLVKNVNDFNIAGYPINSISLTFYNDRLLDISIYMPDFIARAGEQSWLISKDVEKKVKDEYGEGTVMEKTTTDDVNNIIFTTKISGNRVTLFIQQHGLTYVNDQPIVRGNRYIFISHEVHEIKMKESGTKSGF